MNAGLRPKNVARVSSASCHWKDTSGYAGSPSIMTIEARVSSTETSAFHIIHAVVVNHWRRSPARRSQLNVWFFRCSRRMPPWPCTIAFGRPVVPEEKSTYSGCAKATGSNSRGPRLGQELVPADRVREGVAVAARIGNVHDRPQRGQKLPDGGDLLAAVDELVAVAVAGDRQQDGRLELAEPADDAPRTELRRARRPDGAEARGREEGDERLGDVREIGDDAIAGADAKPLQTRASSRDLLAQVAERQLDRPPGLGPGDDRHGVGVFVATEHVLREVEPRAREPLRARHLPRPEHPLVRRMRANLEEVPERAPEALEIADRPLMERVIVGEVEPPLVLQPFM